jgi:hypothetical protein
MQKGKMPVRITASADGEQHHRPRFGRLQNQGTKAFSRVSQFEIEHIGRRHPGKLP